MFSFHIMRNDEKTFWKNAEAFSRKLQHHSDYLQQTNKTTQLAWNIYKLEHSC